MSKKNAIKLFKTDCAKGVFHASIRANPLNPSGVITGPYDGWSVHVYPRKSLGIKAQHKFVWIVWNGDSIHGGIESAIVDGAVIKARSFQSACMEAVSWLMVIEAKSRKTANAKRTHAKVRNRQYAEAGGQ